MYTVTIILDKEMDNVLVCSHQKLQQFMYIGGKVEEFEHPMEASYRELFEETGITKDDVELKFLQQEVTTYADGSVWNLYITYGVLNKDVELIEEKNPLMWVKDWEFLRNCGFDGDAAVHFNRVVKQIVREAQR